ncbi:MAG: WxL domain-containing protein [Lactobacillales bacterium]|jgi:hypothetical protein|nr:WxL domain-containing protein [Lactobacillales bacterium]
MKFKLLLSAVALSLLASAAPTYAADSGTAKTDGTGAFVPGTKADIHYPKDSDDSQIIVEDSTDRDQPILDGLILTYYPDFHFGRTELNWTSNSILIDALVNPAKSDLSEYLPGFVQVADITGDPELTWNVTAALDDEYKTAKGDVLKGAQLRLYEKSILSDYQDEADFASKILAFARSNGEYLNVPNSARGEAPKIVLQNKEKGYTNLTYTSVVFEDDFHKQDYAKADANTRYTGAKLYLPSQKDVVDGDYATTITWTLNTSV